MSKKDEALKLARHVMHNQGDISVDEWIATEKAINEALAEQPAQQALDKMAENARELGLDYEPRAWFTVDELNAWADKKLEENPQWAEQPAQQEPVAYQDTADKCRLETVPAKGGLLPQRTWVGLTDSERGKVYADWRWSDGRTSNLALCEAIEAKLKEKNT